MVEMADQPSPGDTRFHNLISASLTEHCIAHFHLDSRKIPTSESHAFTATTACASTCRYESGMQPSLCYGPMLLTGVAIGVR